jgi:hypothetical protein
MSYLALRNLHDEYAGVIKIANYYAAMYVKGDNKKILSKQPETDLKIAQKSAETFAKENNISFFFESFILLDNPPITVYKHNGNWYPAELYPDRISIFTHLETQSLGGPEHRVHAAAKKIAWTKKADFFPKIGRTLSFHNTSKPHLS